MTLDAIGINESSFVETAKLNMLLGSYNLTADVDKRDNKNVAKVNFTKGNDAILSAYADLEAKITAEVLDKEDISSVKDGNFVITIAKNLAIAGYVDGKSLLAELNKIDEEEEAAYKVYDWSGGKLAEHHKTILDLEQRRVAAFNAYTNLALVSTSEEYKVAKVSFELDVEEEEATGYMYEKDEDGYIIGGSEKEYKYTRYYTDQMFILNFNDNTKVEASVFFGQGFDKVIKMWEDFVVKFN